MARSLHGTGLGKAIGPATRHFSITPHDTNELEVVTTAIFVGTAGDITIVDKRGKEVTWTVPDGFYIPLEATKVKATGTTATGIIGLA